jgi:gluconate 2-dehydrogenase subunit 3-like protein
VHRRSFLVGGISGTALIACRPWTRTTPPPDEPTAHELATLAAIAETFLPGGDGVPGAREAGALAVIVDPAYGVRPYLARTVADLDDWVGLLHGFHAFVDLSPATRELVLEQRMGLHGGAIASWYRPVYDAILALTKLASYGGLANPLGTSYLGFPGPSAGYAPESAAGAYASADRPRALAAGAASTIEVAGAGAVTSVRVNVLAASDAAIRATVRVTAPDGRYHDLGLRRAILADERLPLTGGPAAGTWRLEVVAHAGAPGRLELWSLCVRTDLDDRPDGDR